MKKNLKLLEIRHLFHQYAELSNKEIKTSALIEKYIEPFEPTKILHFNFGLAFVWDSYKPGKTVVFRADIDAVPVDETNELNYSSHYHGISHACGHDGHTTILIGLAEKIFNNRPQKGKVVLLFQPAEETGEGAFKIVNDQEFQSLNTDFIFGLHNIPGFKKKSILLRSNSFACASRGMVIKLIGKASHAAEPENGINPVFAIQKLIEKFYALTRNDNNYKNFALLTIIHIRLGEEAFGTSPGYAEIMLTLRSETNSDMEKLVLDCEKIVESVSMKEKLGHELSYKEVFPATVNNNRCVNLVEKVSNEMKLEIELIDKPFKWSEDFAYFTNKYSGVLFGLGAGVEHPNLHNPDYDFPDEIIETGVDIFYGIYSELFRK